MKINPYTAFTTTNYRMTGLLCIAALTMIGFMLNGYAGVYGIVLFIFFVPSIICFLDFFAFSCASTRKQQSMNFIKSSALGLGFFKSVLKKDIIIKEILTVSGFAGFFLAEILRNEEKDILGAVIMIMLYLPVIQIVEMISLIITRRISGNLFSQMGICYFVSVGGMLISMLYSSILPEDLSEAAVPAIIMFLVLGTVGAGCSVFLYRDCVKGYISGFMDK